MTKKIQDDENSEFNDFDYLNSKYSTVKKSDKLVDLKGYFGDYRQPHGGSTAVYNTSAIAGDLTDFDV
jgi:hypothetical protein